jgi:hypothetical protein
VRSQSRRRTCKSTLFSALSGAVSGFDEHRFSAEFVPIFATDAKPHEFARFNSRCGDEP